MRGKKALLIVTMTLFLVAIIAPNIPVKAQPQTRIWVYSTNGCLPNVAQNAAVDVYVCAEFPAGWDNTASGVVGFVFNLEIDPAVLTPYRGYGDPTVGYFLTDFLECFMYSQSASLLYTIETWGFSGVASMILGWEDLGVGAGYPGCVDTAMGCPDFGDDGYGPLCRLRFRAVQDYAGYSVLKLSNTYYYTPAGKYSFDEVTDGCYGIPEFPLGAAFEIGLVTAVAYIWIRRRKTKPIVAKRFTT